MFAVVVAPAVDVSEYVVSAFAVVGVVVAAVLLAKFGFIVIRAAVRWAQDFADDRQSRREEDAYWERRSGELAADWGPEGDGMKVGGKEINFASMSEAEVDQLWRDSDWT